MSKDIIVLTPNGRRQKVHCTPDTSILQVLEDVCEKQGYQPTDYDLKHHNTILDLTNTVRFSNLPNKATLEMIETDRKRNETNVTIGLMLEDGERRTAEFSPKTTLYELIMSLAASEFSSIPNPTILYMRQEVAGVNALKTKTLRQLGLFGGRAILRLLSKAEEATQAHVSAVYRKQPTANQENKSDGNNKLEITYYDTAVAGPSDVGKTQKSVLSPIEVIKKEKTLKTHVTLQDKKECDSIGGNPHAEKLTYEEPVQTRDVAMDIDQTKSDIMSSTVSSISVQNNLERRLKIEEEVTFLGTQKAIVFMQPDSPNNEVDDLPDDFYELTIEEVRKLYTELQQQRIKLENTPLITSSQRKDLEETSSEQKLNIYKNVVVRIQFPDQIILQGVFSPTDTIGKVINFVKEHLQNPNRPFHIFTTPLKESLDPKITLSEARYVPCVHMHFKWLQDDTGPPYLKEDTYSRQTSSDAAGILASKYRAPSRRLDDASSSAGTSSKSKNSKVPKWFKS